MQQVETGRDWESVSRQRVESMVQTLSALGSRGESLAEVAHDARNMVTALGLYCDLLEEPGVLAVPFAHYGSELRLVAAASRRLVEKLVALDSQLGMHPGERRFQGAEPAGPEAAPLSGSPYAAGLGAAQSGTPEAGSGRGGAAIADRSPSCSGEHVVARSPERGRERARPWEAVFAEPVDNLAAELLANRNLLSALAGPGIAVTLDTAGGARPVRLTAEDLTRILVNLVKNAAEAIPGAPGAGRIQITLKERPGVNGIALGLELAIEDDGPGIPADLLNRVFDSGFTTHSRDSGANEDALNAHRGLGLAIARSIVEAAGGRIGAMNRPHRGARFEIELPVRTP